jgi:protein phosphatase
VADGVGGAAGGEVASAETVTAMVGSLTATPVEDPPAALWRAVTLANGRVRDVSQTDPHLSGMATTLVAALVRGNDAWIVSLGDSRAYLARDGSIDTLTEDDSWLAEQVRAGTLSPEDAARSPYQNVITRGIGVEERLKIEEPGHLRLRHGDRLLLCSDGLYRCVTPETMADTMTKLTPSEASARLIELANRAGGPDNISVAIYGHEDAETAPTMRAS